MDACLQILGLSKNFTLEQLDEALANRLLGATELQKQTIYNAYRIILNSIEQPKILIRNNKFIKEELNVKGTIVGLKKKKYRLIKGQAKGRLSYIYTPETILEIVYANTVSYYINHDEDYDKMIYKTKYQNQISLLESKLDMINSSKVDCFKKLSALAIKYCINFIKMKLKELEPKEVKKELTNEEFDLSKYRKLKFYKESLEYQKNLERGKAKLDKNNRFIRRETL